MVNKKALLETDKKQHIVVLFLITLVACLFTKDVFKALIISAFIGLGKEIYDYFTGGVACLDDLAANFIGIFIALLVFITIQEITKNKEVI